MAEGRFTTALFLLFASCQFALTTSTSAPQLTVVGGFSPVYSCPKEQVTLRCTWNPGEVLFGGLVVNGTLHALEELEALAGHTAITGFGQINFTITSSHTSTTTYSCAVTPHGGVSGPLRSDPTTVNCDHSGVLTPTITRITDSALSITVQVLVQHRGCTDPIENVMVAINSTEDDSCTYMVNSGRRDLGPCEFTKGLLSNESYNVRIMTQPNGGSYSVYHEQIISLSDPEDSSTGGAVEDGNNTTESTRKTLIIGVCAAGVVLLFVGLVILFSAVICIYLYLRSRKDCCPLKSYDKPSRDCPPPSNPVQSESSLQRTSESSDTSAEAYSSDPLMHQISNEPADQVNNKDVYEQPNIPPSVPARVAPPTAQPLVPPRAPIDPNAIQYAELDHSGPRPIKPPPLENVRYVRIQQHRKNFAPHVQPPTAPATAVQGAANV